MRFKGLDLNLLITLDALLTERNVSAAARKVFLSQPAMSGALARPREHFQDAQLVPLADSAYFHGAGPRRPKCR